METEIRKHLRGVRILVTLSLLVACLSFAFSYVLFQEVSVPLQKRQAGELASLRERVDDLVAAGQGRSVPQVTMLWEAVRVMQFLREDGSDVIRGQAAKAEEETRRLLEILKKTPPK